MTIEMTDKWVTSFRFKNNNTPPPPPKKKKKKKRFLIDFIFCRLAETTISGSPSVTWLFPEVMSVWGVSAVAILDFSVNCVCVWSTKKLTMPAYCVAANGNNSQTTPGITMHELPRNRSAVRRKWIQFIQFKRASRPLFCVASTSVSAILQTPWNTGTLSKSCLTGSIWYGCILVGLSGKVSVSSSELELAILQRLPRVT